MRTIGKEKSKETSECRFYSEKYVTNCTSRIVLSFPPASLTRNSKKERKKVKVKVQKSNFEWRSLQF